MSTTVTLDEATAKLRELISKLAPGDEVVITENEQPVAKLVSQRSPVASPRTPGNCKGMITLLGEDEEHLKDFAEYMP
jgi:antitoxin (DNA-binding transcriptional repressor) of toxin-antitoxin stability system